MALILISAGLEQISRHLSPCLDNSSLPVRLLRNTLIHSVIQTVGATHLSQDIKYSIISFPFNSFIFHCCCFFSFFNGGKKIQTNNVCNCVSVSMLVPLWGLNKGDFPLTFCYGSGVNLCVLITHRVHGEVSKRRS